MEKEVKRPDISDNVLYLEFDIPKINLHCVIFKLFSMLNIPTS